MGINVRFLDGEKSMLHSASIIFSEADRKMLQKSSTPFNLKKLLVERLRLLFNPNFVSNTSKFKG